MDDDNCTGCVDGMRTVTDVWARQEAGLPKWAWPAHEIAAHMTGAHYTEPRLGCLVCWVEAIHAQTQAHGRDPEHYPAPPDNVATLADQWSRYSAALNTVFPCPSCRPQQFAKWRNGCYRANHQPRRCRVCKEAAK